MQHEALVMGKISPVPCTFTQAWVERLVGRLHTLSPPHFRAPVVLKVPACGATGTFGRLGLEEGH